MEWRQDLNETTTLADGNVRFRVYATGEGLEVSLDNKNFIKSNCTKQGVEGFEFVVNPNDVPKRDGKKLQNFWVKEWGALLVPESGSTKPEPQPLPQPKPIPVPDGSLNWNPNFPNYDKIGGTQVLSDWWKGWVGYSYGSDYWQLIPVLGGGEYHFEFYGQNTNYPKPRKSNSGVSSQNGLVQMDFPTHSTTCEWSAVNTYRTISKVKMELHDQYGNLVWRLYDTKGGMHPTTTGNDVRGNNHPDNCKRWLVPATYTIKYWNLNDPLGNGKQSQRFEFMKGGNWMEETEVEAGDYKEFTIDLRELSYYKLNCNLY